MKKRNWLFFLLLMGMGVLGIGVNTFHKEPGEQVIIRIEGKVVERFSLKNNRTKEIITKNGKNKLIIQDKQVWLEEADCPDELCVHQGKIKNNGEVIVCLPHKLVIEIQKKGEEELVK